MNTWIKINKYVPPNVKYQDLIESLKVNKDIKNLPRFVGDHILTVLQKVEDQNIEQVLEVLKIKYGRSRMEQVEECIQHRLEFRENNYEEENEYLSNGRVRSQRERVGHLIRGVEVSLYAPEDKEKENIEEFPYQTL